MGMHYEFHRLWEGHIFSPGELVPLLLEEYNLLHSCLKSTISEIDGSSVHYIV